MEVLKCKVVWKFVSTTPMELFVIDTLMNLMLEWHAGNWGFLQRVSIIIIIGSNVHQFGYNNIIHFYRCHNIASTTY